MQPFTAQLASTRFQPNDQSIRIGTAAYQVKFEGAGGYVEELGTQGKRKLPIVHVMGGKNTYYLLTPMERGRLQVLPLAYDVQSKKWYDMAASGVRTHSGGAPQTPLAWTDSAFTFNTSCYSCHVSQLHTNYDAATDSYNTSWKEPGINCESCHSDAAAHAGKMKGLPGNNVDDPQILKISQMNPVERVEMCAPCHAKMTPLSSGYKVTQRFFDHYDLTALESSDYYPDGRDLGENYTFTSWLLNPCNRDEKFDCLHCHASTGAVRFTPENSDQACLPCHQSVVSNSISHSRHKTGSVGARCIGCHMPKTRFANMTRSDHSFLPPTPGATLQFQSPNACNVCHSDKTAAWADALVRQWYRPGYQKPALDRAQLIDAARKQQWNRAPAMLAFIQNPKSNPVVSASLLRLMRAWDGPQKWPVFLEKLSDANPLVRGAAAAALLDNVARNDVQLGLLKATSDEYRLVRIRAAASLAPVPPAAIRGDAIAQLQKATMEFETSLNSRPDDFNGQTSLGNFYLRRGEMRSALQAFERAIRLRPDSVGTLVNASVAYSRAGRAADAERVLRQALQHAPQNAAVLFNLGLLLAESNRTGEAEAALGAAFTADPNLAPAAYNLAILISSKDLKQSISLCRKAVAISAEPRYVKALAQFLAKDGQIAEAKRVFEKLKPQ